MLDEHPGQPVARQEMQRLRPVNYTPSQPLVRQAPPGRPATPVIVPNTGLTGNQMGSTQPNQPVNQPGNQPGIRPSEPNRGFEPPVRNDRPAMGQPNIHPDMTPSAPNRPSEPSRTFEPPARNDRPATSQPPQNMRPAASPRQEEPPSRPQNPPQVERPQQHTAPPAEFRPAPQQHTQPSPKQQTTEDKKHDDKKH